MSLNNLFLDNGQHPLIPMSLLTWNAITDGNTSYAVNGTPNQINVVTDGGTSTISLPQNIIMQASGSLVTTNVYASKVDTAELNLVDENDDVVFAFPYLTSGYEIALNEIIASNGDGSSTFKKLSDMTTATTNTIALNTKSDLLDISVNPSNELAALFYSSDNSVTVTFNAIAEKLDIHAIGGGGGGGNATVIGTTNQIDVVTSGNNYTISLPTEIIMDIGGSIELQTLDAIDVIGYEYTIIDNASNAKFTFPTILSNQTIANGSLIVGNGTGGSSFETLGDLIISSNSTIAASQNGTNVDLNVNASTGLANLFYSSDNSATVTFNITEQKLDVQAIGGGGGGNATVIGTNNQISVGATGNTYTISLPTDIVINANGSITVDTLDAYSLDVTAMTLYDSDGDPKFTFPTILGTDTIANGAFIVGNGAGGSSFYYLAQLMTTADSSIGYIQDGNQTSLYLRPTGLNEHMRSLDQSIKFNYDPYVSTTYLDLSVNPSNGLASKFYSSNGSVDISYNAAMSSNQVNLVVVGGNGGSVIAGDFSSAANTILISTNLSQVNLDINTNFISNGTLTFYPNGIPSANDNLTATFNFINVGGQKTLRFTFDNPIITPSAGPYQFYICALDSYPALAPYGPPGTDVNLMYNTNIAVLNSSGYPIQTNQLQFTLDNSGGSGFSLIYMTMLSMSGTFAGVSNPYIEFVNSTSYAAYIYNGVAIQPTTLLFSYF